MVLIPNRAIWKIHIPSWYLWHGWTTTGNVEPIRFMHGDVFWYLDPKKDYKRTNRALQKTVKRKANRALLTMRKTPSSVSKFIHLATAASRSRNGIEKELAIKMQISKDAGVVKEKWRSMFLRILCKGPWRGEIYFQSSNCNGRKPDSYDIKIYALSGTNRI